MTFREKREIRDPKECSNTNAINLIIFFVANQKFLSLDKKLGGVSQVALVVKNLPANAGGIREMGLIPGSGRSPRGGLG